MKFALGVALLLVASMPGRAQIAQVDGISIFEYGIYTIRAAGKETKEGVATGDIWIGEPHELISETEIIYASLGTIFGMRYAVLGSPAGTPILLTLVTRFPDSGVLNSKDERFNDQKIQGEHIIGVNGFLFYKFDETWELAPGNWTLELHYQGRKLGEKRFTVVLPAS